MMLNEHTYLHTNSRSEKVVYVQKYLPELFYNKAALEFFSKSAGRKRAV